MGNSARDLLQGKNGISYGVKNNEELRSNFRLLVGRYVHDDETDELKFVALPQPLYLDTMRRNQIRGEGDFQELLCLGNDMLNCLLADAEQLKPGEDVDLEEIVVKLVRTKTSQEVKHKTKRFSFIKR